eukprot:CAMPEP_0201553184 /NCGR_PEP_ID=MMETSP0173_2-20130828/19492_1 /ASSEMBLY_ACC=CAM_ASM_000268 /TAXON_ID=218659 /ORGANISM="Vexillifera sp., Strain DIVA3 564/2" /LENGTH=287 /DNA_ID=CAMNT_0047963809 /DNA_START=25 /DNA_END=888 /DNA_ORIENTATION=-
MASSSAVQKTESVEDFDVTGSVFQNRQIQEAKAASFTVVKRGIDKNLTSPLSVIDVGCGNGDDLLTIAQIVPPNSHLVGVDIALDKLSVAEKKLKQLIKQKKIDSTIKVEFKEGDVVELDEWCANTFDLVRCERLLIHVDEVDKALEEMYRIAKVGGRIVTLEPDTRTATFCSPRQDLQAIFSKIRKASDGYLRHPSIGSQIPSLYKKYKIKVRGVRVEPHALLSRKPTASDSRFEAFVDTLDRCVSAKLISDEERDVYIQGLKDGEKEDSVMQTSIVFLVEAEKEA